MKKILTILLLAISTISFSQVTLRKGFSATEKNDTVWLTYSNGSWTLNSDTTFIIKGVDTLYLWDGTYLTTADIGGVDSLFFTDKGEWIKDTIPKSDSSWYEINSTVSNLDTLFANRIELKDTILDRLNIVGGRDISISCDNGFFRITDENTTIDSDGVPFNVIGNTSNISGDDGSTFFEFKNDRIYKRTSLGVNTDTVSFLSDRVIAKNGIINKADSIKPGGELYDTTVYTVGSDTARIDIPNFALYGDFGPPFDQYTTPYWGFNGIIWVGDTLAYTTDGTRFPDNHFFINSGIPSIAPFSALSFTSTQATEDIFINSNAANGLEISSTKTSTDKKSTLLLDEGVFSVVSTNNETSPSLKYSTSIQSDQESVSVIISELTDVDTSLKITKDSLLAELLALKARVAILDTIIADVLTLNGTAVDTVINLKNAVELENFDVINTDLLKTSRIERDTTYHAIGGFEDSTLTVSIVSKDTWYQVTNSTNDAFIGVDAQGFDLSGDTLIFLNSGDYRGTISVTFSGNSGNEYQFRIYNATKAEQVAFRQGETATGTSSFSNVCFPVYASVNKNDGLVIQVENISASNDVIIRHIQFEAVYLHE